MPGFLTLFTELDGAMAKATETIEARAKSSAAQAEASSASAARRSTCPASTRR
jgi:hypothetical protein